MDFAEDLTSIFNTLKEIFKYFAGPSKPKRRRMPKRKSELEKDNGTFQSPLRSAWKSLGNFTPGVYLNEKHKGGHYGVDMAAPQGTSIYPFAPGKVLSAGQSPGNTLGGITVTLLHPNKLMTYYAHLSSVSVKKGDRVNLNTQIGSVGNTGNASDGPPHLHFEIHRGINPKNPTENWQGTATDPAAYFSVPKYLGTIPAKDNAIADEHIDKLIVIAEIYNGLSKK